MNFYFISVDHPLITQYKTKAQYKSNLIVLKYAFLLVKKYKFYLQKKKCYFSAILFSLMRFCSNLNLFILPRLFYSLAFIFLPTSLKLDLLNDSRIFNKLKSIYNFYI